MKYIHVNVLCIDVLSRLFVISAYGVQRQRKNAQNFLHLPPHNTNGHQLGNVLQFFLELLQGVHFVLRR